MRDIPPQNLAIKAPCRASDGGRDGIGLLAREERGLATRLKRSTHPLSAWPPLRLATQCDRNVCGRAYGNPDIEAVVMRDFGLCEFIKDSCNKVYKIPGECREVKAGKRSGGRSED